MIEAAHQRAVNEETVLHHAPRTADIAQAATTSSLMTRNLTRSIRPKLVVSATSAASRPVPIRMRPIRGLLWRGAEGGQPPGRKGAKPPPTKISPGGRRNTGITPATIGETPPAAPPAANMRPEKGR